jgi:hypothetical protein
MNLNVSITGNLIVDALLLILGSLSLTYTTYVVVKNLIESFLIKAFGFIRIYYFTKNYRVKKALTKPKEEKVKVFGRELPFNNAPGYIYFNGDHPTAFYMEGSTEQMKLDSKPENIDPAKFDKLCMEFYTAGRLTALKKAGIQDMLMILIVIMGLIMLIGFGWLIKDMGAMKEILTEIAKKLA